MVPPVVSGVRSYLTGSSRIRSTFVTALGESHCGTESWITIPAVTGPARRAVRCHSERGNLRAEGIIRSPSARASARPRQVRSIHSPFQSCNLVHRISDGDHGIVNISRPNYTLTFVTATGETTWYAGPSGGLSIALTSGQNAVSFTSLPTSGDTRVTGRRLYRSQAGGGGELRLVATITDNITTTWTDTVADISRGGAMPTSNTASGGQVRLTNIPLSADGRVTKRHIYRSVVNGTTTQFVTSLPDNTTTSYTDNTADWNLGSLPPSVNTTWGQVALSASPSRAIRVTMRRIYRRLTEGR